MLIHESLDQYVRRILLEKGLTMADVERLSEGRISDSYIANITNGQIKNITIDKLKALARGLGVEETQVFIAACGISFPEEGEIQKSKFARLFYKYGYLTNEDKEQIDVILDMLDREIERRLTNRLPMPVDSVFESPLNGKTSRVENDPCNGGSNISRL